MTASPVRAIIAATPQGQGRGSPADLDGEAPPRGSYGPFVTRLAVAAHDRPVRLPALNTSIDGNGRIDMHAETPEGKNINPRFRKSGPARSAARESMMGDIQAECLADQDRYAPIADILRETIMNHVTDGDVPELARRASEAAGGAIMKNIAEGRSREESASFFSELMESAGGGESMEMASRTLMGKAIADGLQAAVRDGHDLRAFDALSESLFREAHQRVMMEQSRATALRIGERGDVRESRGGTTRYHNSADFADDASAMFAETLKDYLCNEILDATMMGMARNIENFVYAKGTTIIGKRIANETKSYLVCEDFSPLAKRLEEKYAVKGDGAELLVDSDNMRPRGSGPMLVDLRNLAREVVYGGGESESHWAPGAIEDMLGTQFSQENLRKRRGGVNEAALMEGSGVDACQKKLADEIRSWFAGQSSSVAIHHRTARGAPVIKMTAVITAPAEGDLDSPWGVSGEFKSFMDDGDMRDCTYTITGLWDEDDGSRCLRAAITAPRDGNRLFTDCRETMDGAPDEGKEDLREWTADDPVKKSLDSALHAKCARIQDTSMRS